MHHTLLQLPLDSLDFAMTFAQTLQGVSKKVFPINTEKHTVHPTVGIPIVEYRFWLLIRA
jgi:hypothetical protein